MGDDRELSYARGRNPWDPINGLRVGGLAGGIVGTIPTIVWGPGMFWIVIAGAALGGAVGFWVEKRKAHAATRS